MGYLTLLRVLGPYAVILLAVASCGIQSSRLTHAKADLATARAALYVPGPDGKPTRATWEQKASVVGQELGVCHQNVAEAMGEIASQNSSLEASKAETARKAAALAQALQAAKKTAAAARSDADRILNINAKGADTCQRMLDAERQITEGP